MTMEVMSTERKTRKNVESPPGLAPGLPVRLLSVTVLPHPSSLRLASKVRDGFRFPESPQRPIMALHASSYLCLLEPSPGFKVWGTRDPFTFFM